MIATHSPIVLAYPGAKIVRVGAEGIEVVGYDDAEPVAVTRAFLADRERYVARLLDP